MQNPDIYKLEVKPLQVPVKKNGACNHVGGGSHRDVQNLGAPTQPMMPYGFYPSPHLYFPIQQQGWRSFAPPGPSSLQPMVGPGFQYQGQSMPIKSTRGPAITDWLQYCDNHPDRKGAAFVTLVGKFKDQGYRTIEQLTSSRMSVVDLSTWLEIGKGTADLIIQYVDEDMNLVRNGMFRMEHAPASEDNWAIEE